MVEVIHASLAKRDWLPSEHLVDAGYTSARVLLESQREHQVSLIGPVADDPSWQARAGTGFDKAHFQVDWEHQIVTCPCGKQSRSWSAKTTVPGVIAEARSRPRTAPPVPSGRRAQRPKKSPASSACKPETNTKSYRHSAKRRKPPRLISSTLYGPAWKVPTHKRYGAAGCDSAATLGRPKPIFNTSSRPWPST